MLSQNYDISFYIAWEMRRKEHPVIAKLSQKTKRLIDKELSPTLGKVFSGKLTPDDGNPAIKKFRETLQDFKYENRYVKIDMRDTFSVEGFAIEDKESFVLGQYLLHFEIYNKDKETSADNYPHVQALLLNEIKKIKVQTDRAIIKVTDFRMSGQVKNNLELWPAASTEF